jgi:hypothetical protein
MMVEKIKTSLNKRILLAVLIAVCCFGLLSGQTAKAQSQTTLAVEPEAREVPFGNQVVLELTVTLGLNVNAFDLTVEYDPEVLSFEAWENGDYLTNLATVKEVNDPGTFRLAVTQLAQPAVSGDGVLIALTFNSEGAGESSINLVDVAFADSQGNKFEPETVDGMVAVTLSPTFTSTPTPTRTPTTKPTLTSTPDPNDGTAYPAKNDVTATPTSGPSGNSETGTYVAPGVEAQAGTAYPENTDAPPTQAEQDEAGAASTDQSAGETNQDSNAELTVEEKAAAEPEKAEDQLESAKSGWNALLWVILIIALLAMAVFVLIAIRRRRNNGEDLLI